MKRLSFKCTLLSDVVLNSTAATEALNNSLDYIPGSNFLGIAARNYKDFKNDAFTVFHSGEVRFEDAHISSGGIRSLRKPASWYFPKGDDKQEYYIHHLLNSLEKPDKPLKQVRSGYFIEAGPEYKTVASEHEFTLKSAYNAEERRSDEGRMYGYDAIRKKSQWLFSIRSEDEALLKRIAEYLCGEKSLGRSRTAQYGRVLIEPVENSTETTVHKNWSIGNNSYIFIYLESNCAFLNKNLTHSPIPEITDLCLEENQAEICWELSQPIFRSYAPWNSTRKTRDPDRVCMEKGSVVALKLNTEVDPQTYAEKLEKGIGLHTSEGFGRVQVNPSFLFSNQGKINMSEEAAPDKAESKHLSAVAEDASDSDVIAWLEGVSKRAELTEAALESVTESVKEFSSSLGKNKLKKSQWGAVRGIAQGSDSYGDMMNRLFENPPENGQGGGFTKHGKSEKYWRTLSQKLEKKVAGIKNSNGENTARRFLVKLCAEIARDNEDTEKEEK